MNSEDEDFDHYFHEAIRLVNNKDIDIRREALHSIGSLRYPDDPYFLDEAFLVLESVVNKEAEDILLASAVNIAFDLYQRNNLLADRATGLLDLALAKGGDTALWAASRNLLSLLKFERVDIRYRVDLPPLWFVHG